MIRFALTAVALVAASICLPASAAFVGQDAAPAASGPARPSPMAPQSNGALNAPNANAIERGGIQANQLAAANSALDMVLYSAIESGDVEGVRSALKSGANLRQDFGYACDLSQGALDHNHPAEEKFFNLSSPDSGRMIANAVPGHCSRQHFVHAMLAADKATFSQGFSEESAVMTAVDPNEVARFRFNDPRAGDVRARAVAKLNALRQARDNAFEILALIDANVPAADKAFYPAYLSTTAIGVARNPIVDRWVLDRYFEALPEIKRARTLREPSRLAWDAFKSQQASKLGDKPVSGLDYYEMAVFDPASLPNGDESYTLKEAATKILLANRSKFQNFAQAAVCDAGANLARQDANPAAAKSRQYAPARAMLAFNRKYLADRVDAYTSKGLAALPYSQAERELKAINASDFDQREIDMWAQAISYYEAHSLEAFLLERPEVVAALNNKQTTPGGSRPPLHVIAAAPGDATSPAMVRALLVAGVSPDLRDAQGKTAADLVLGTDPVAMWRAQAFLKKDLVDGGCRPAR